MYITSIFIISLFVNSVNCFNHINVKKNTILRSSHNKWLESAVLATGIIAQTNIAEAITPVSLSEVYTKIDSKEIRKAQISSDNKRIVYIDNLGETFSSTIIPSYDLISSLIKSKADVIVENEDQNFASSFIYQLSVLTVIGYFLSRLSGNNPIFQMPKLDEYKAEINTNITFSQVLGCDYAKLEVEEIVDFLKNPVKYKDLGLKIPKGILLSGPPGVGKTLLAKATAGEADVPFFSVSGSEFVEMFVGMGAARVRKIFKEARKFPVSIIFIDEFDALGKRRGVNTVAGGNDEKEQTLNQLLVEMDGFSSTDGIIVMASTNRNELLDPALLRPGRFDRQVQLRLPDTQGRIDILEMYGNNIKKDNFTWGDVSLETPGYSGADLRNLVNEAGIFSVRRNSSSVSIEDINSAIEKQDIGVEVQMQRYKEVDQLIAYHEAGHAVVGTYLNDYDKVVKISIIPSSKGSGGFTKFRRQGKYLDGGMYDRAYLENQIVAALGGRAAEELVYGTTKVTTGAGADIQTANNLARQMITQFGMNNEIGLLCVDPNDSLNSEILKSDIDTEVREIVEKSYLLAKIIISENYDTFKILTDELLLKGKLYTYELDEILKKI